jgi:hypothetical protein
MTAIAVSCSLLAFVSAPLARCPQSRATHASTLLGNDSRSFQPTAHGARHRRIS